jgi:WD40 repeat protein/energy-coupling factor transporter ATP-binding protein EcfA2
MPAERQQDAKDPAQPPPDSGFRQQARASGGSTIVQVGGDFTVNTTARLVELFEDDPIGECPYPGLLPFEEGQAKWFFGRDQDLAALRERLDRAAGEGGPVVLIGASGAGKSSLLRCGLLSAVAANGHGKPRSREWPRRVLTPGAEPVLALAEAMSPLTGEPAEVLLARWTAEPASARTSLCATLKGRLLVVIDQFEEVFTATNEPRRADFLRLLDSISAGTGAPAMVVLGLRADFYGHCLSDPWLREAVRDDPVQLGPIERHDLERVVLGPAEQVGLTVQPDLREALLADMGTGAVGEDASGRLPLLAHALRATWLKRSGKTLTLAGYQDTGGIHGAIAATADRVFAKLDESGQEAARAVFLRLVRIGDDTLEDTRRHITREELAFGFPDPDAVAQVVVAYTQRRLLGQQRAGLTITHEALLHAWPRLRSWIDADRTSHVFRQELEARVQSWELADRDASALQRGTMLENAEQWALQHPRDVTDPISHFLSISRTAEYRRRRRRRILVAALTVLALVATVTAGVAIVEQREAATQERLAQARVVAQQAKNLMAAQPGLAAQLAIAAYQLDHDSGRSALVGALGAPGTYDAADAVVDFAQTRDSSMLALSTGNAIALWSSAGHALGRINDLRAGPVALSHDGRITAAGTEETTDSTIRLWDTADPSHPRPLVTLPASRSEVTGVAIDAGKGRLAAATRAGPILLWDITDPGRPRELPALAGHPGGTESLAFPSTGPAVLASAGADHVVRVWRLAGTEVADAKPVEIADFAGSKSDSDGYLTKVTHRVAFTPDGQGLATSGDNDGLSLRLWDLKNPAPRLAAESKATFLCDIDTFRMITISDNPNTTMATLCSGEIQLWQLTGTHSIVEEGHIAADSRDTGTMLFQAKENVLLTATRSGVWKRNVNDPTHTGALGTFGVKHPGLTMGFALSSGPRQLVAVAGSDSGELWQITDDGTLHTALLTKFPPSSFFAGKSAAFSPGGDVLAISENTTKSEEWIHPVIRLRDTTKPDVPIIATIDSELDNSAEDLKFSADGKVLSLVDSNDYTAGRRKPPTVKLFDVAEPKQPRLIATLPGVEPQFTTFSPVGRLLVVNRAGGIQPWDISNAHAPVPQPGISFGPGTDVTGSAFSPDGKTLAVGDSGGTVRLYKVADNRLTGPVSTFRAPGSQAYHITFSPDGRTLAIPATSGGLDGESTGPRIELWDISDPLVPVLEANVRDRQVDEDTAGPVAYVHDGRALVTAAPGQWINMWSTDPDRDWATLCRQAGDPITPEQWRKYLPHHPFTPPCPS